MDCLLKSTFVPNHLRRRPARAPFVKPTLPLHAFAFFASPPLRALRFPLALPLRIPCAVARQDAAPPRRGAGFRPAERPRAGCPRSGRGPARRALRLFGACQTYRRLLPLNFPETNQRHPMSYPHQWACNTGMREAKRIAWGMGMGYISSRGFTIAKEDISSLR